jgi:hypothetical protein
MSRPTSATTAAHHLCYRPLLVLQLVAPHHQRRGQAPVGVLHQEGGRLAQSVLGLVSQDLVGWSVGLYVCLFGGWVGDKALWSKRAGCGQLT